MGTYAREQDEIWKGESWNIYTIVPSLRDRTQLYLSDRSRLSRSGSFRSSGKRFHMIAPIVWILFETTGTIGTIQTVIWKPGLILRCDDYGGQNKLNLKCCVLSFSSLAHTASFSDLNSFVLDFYFFHVHTAFRIQLHEGIKKRAEEQLHSVESLWSS